MAKKKKVDERAVEVDCGPEPYARACAEVKKVSGFEACLPLRARLIGDNKIEYQFLVGDDEGSLKTELFARQLEAERTLSGCT
jgi:hypothetical protein